MIYLGETLRTYFQLIKMHERVRTKDSKQAFYGHMIDLHHELGMDFTQVKRLNDALRAQNNQPILDMVQEWNNNHPGYSITMNFTTTKHYYVLPYHSLFIPNSTANDYNDYYDKSTKYWAEEVVQNNLVTVAELLLDFDHLMEEIVKWLQKQVPETKPIVVVESAKDDLEKFIDKNIDENELNPKYVIHLLLNHLSEKDYKTIKKVLDLVL